MRKYTKDMPKDVKAVGIGFISVYIGGALFILGIPTLILFIWKPQLLLLIVALVVWLVIVYKKGKP